MAKDTFYFSHDYNARNDPKILELRSEYGMEGVGLYWCLIETLAEDENGYIITPLMGGLSVGFGIPKARLIEVVDFMVKIELLCKDDNGIFSRRMMEHKKLRKTLSDKGKEGAKKRWGDSPPITHPITPPNAKERKGKNDRDKSLSEWRNNFEVYLTEAKQEFKKAVEDKNLLTEQAMFYPTVDIVKTIYKAYKNFWGTEAGWKHKKKSRSNEIDWRLTIINSISQSQNKVYYTKQELAEKER